MCLIDEERSCLRWNDAWARNLETEYEPCFRTLANWIYHFEFSCYLFSLSFLCVSRVWNTNKPKIWRFFFCTTLEYRICRAIKLIILLRVLKKTSEPPKKSCIIFSYIHKIHNMKNALDHLKFRSFTHQLHYSSTNCSNKTANDKCNNNRKQKQKTLVLFRFTTDSCSRHSHNAFKKEIQIKTITHSGVNFHILWGPLAKQKHSTPPSASFVFPHFLWHKPCRSWPRRAGWDGYHG